MRWCVTNDMWPRWLGYFGGASVSAPSVIPLMLNGVQEALVISDMSSAGDSPTAVPRSCYCTCQAISTKIGFSDGKRTPQRDELLGAQYLTNQKLNFTVSPSVMSSLCVPTQ
ncbi:hypothetical protein PRIPAC_82629 [Pristionchus pacificus]|uniref:Uncharacterized protein n=1 Tax=Pristionchus pacificus TaxID=54126 RepID=A0A2A6CQV9_PRIPA|nr:hypothetical protein PRIPAC_82629 [Pristionchus pacificus]|eukprot:PDM80447.1 hypothetical protein PRIPAC_33026 [Pristionchus pacificus]